jgi:hypothetical protein
MVRIAEFSNAGVCHGILAVPKIVKSEAARPFPGGDAMRSWVASWTTVRSPRGFDIV